MSRGLLLLLALVAVGGYGTAALAIEAKAKVIALLGTVTIKASQSASPEVAMRQQEISVGGVLETGENSSAKISLPDQTQIQLAAHSSVLLQDLSVEKVTVVALQQGESRVSLPPAGAVASAGVQLSTPDGGTVSATPGVKSGGTDLQSAERLLVASLGDDAPLLLAEAAEQAGKRLVTKPGRGEFIARKGQVENIGGVSVSVSSPGQGMHSLSAGFALEQNLDGQWGVQQEISPERLGLYHRNPQQVSRDLLPLEGGAFKPLATVAFELAEQLAADQEHVAAGEGEAEKGTEIFSTYASGISAMIREVNLGVQEGVASQRAQQFNQQPLEGAHSLRTVTIGISYQ